MENTPRILIVDDEPIVRESIRDWLKDTGYQVATAESSEEAFELIKEQEFSVMVLDVKWPGKTGLTLLKETRAVRPRLKFIVMTASAFASPEVAVEAMKLGAVDYLIKPVASDVLERLIRETLLEYKNQE